MSTGRWVFVVGIVIGLLTGLLAGLLRTPDPSVQEVARRDCPSADNASIDPLRVTVGFDDVVSVRAQFTATVDGLGTRWRELVEPSDLAGCLMMNELTAGAGQYLSETGLFRSPEYRWNAEAERLELSYPNQVVEVQPEQTPRVPVRAWLNGGLLVIEADPCPPEVDGWLCEPGSEYVLVVGLPAEASDDAVTSEVPTAINVDDLGTVWRTWDVPATTAPISVSVPLSPAQAMRLLSSNSSLAEVASSYPGGPRFSWALLWWELSSLLMGLFTAVVVSRLMRSSTAPAQPRFSAAGWAILSGYLVLAVAGGANSWYAGGISWTALGLALSALLWHSTQTGATARRTTWVPALALVALATFVAQVVLVLTEELHPMGPWLGVGAVLAGLTSALMALAALLGANTVVVPTRQFIPFVRREVTLRRPLVRIAGVALIVGLAFAAGYELAWLTRTSFSTSDWANSVAELLAGNIESTMVSIAPLAYGGVLIAAMKRAGRLAQASVPDRSGAVIALALVLAMLVDPPTTVVGGTAIPLWSITFAAMLVLLRNARPAAPDPLTPENHRSLLRAAKQRASSAATSGSPGSPATLLFALGPRTEWWLNGVAAAGLAAIIGLVPTSIFVWQALGQLTDDLYSNTVLYLAVGALLQLARWIAIGFVFGSIYRLLPGAHGPLKGLALASIWAVSALLGSLVSGWLAPDVPSLWVYSSLQLGVFVAVLAVTYDLATLHVAGASARELGSLYRIDTVRRALAYLGPLVLAVAGLVLETRSGAGAQLTEQVLSVLQSVE